MLRTRASNFLLAAPERLAAGLSNRYRIERELGRGGMATVYLAEDLKHGRKVTPELVRQISGEELQRLLSGAPAGNRFELAGQLYLDMMLGTDSPEFLTLVAYDHL